MLLLVAAPLVMPDVTIEYTARDVLLVTIVGFFEAVYVSALAGGYRTGDLSLVYPLARPLPAVMVTVGSCTAWSVERNRDALLGRRNFDRGCVFLPLDRLSSIGLRSYWNRTFLFAGLAALGTTGYSLVDDEALRGLRFAHPDVHPAGVTLVYSFYQVLTTGFWLAVFVFPRRTGRASFRSAMRDWKFALPTGAVITVTYVLILVALAFARDVSYVVAFRQSSIPIGVAIGVLFFKESTPLPKLIGTGVLVLGLLLVSLA